MSVLTAIGLMSGASLDGVRAALLRTDGENIVEVGQSHFEPYSRDMKIAVRRAAKAALEHRDGAAEIGKASKELTDAHVIAVENLLASAGLKRTEVNVIGLNGHTILHKPKRAPESPGRIWQIGDGRVLAEETKIDVVSDLRSADIAEGGEGGPLTPTYFAARARALEPDGAVGVIDLGRVANVTFIPRRGGALDLLSFDAGPGTALVDEWVALRTGEAMDINGALAKSGQVHADILRMMLLNPFIRRKPPKALDRLDFKIEPVLALSIADGAATLTALSAGCLRASVPHLPEAPRDWIVVGGGRRNPALMEALAKALEGDVHTAESIGWRGDDLDAESLAYCAVRSLRKMPLTYPHTTRTPRPTRGGVHHRAPV